MLHSSAENGVIVFLNISVFFWEHLTLFILNPDFLSSGVRSVKLRSTVSTHERQQQKTGRLFDAQNIKYVVCAKDDELRKNNNSVTGHHFPFFVEFITLCLLIHCNYLILRTSEEPLNRTLNYATLSHMLLAFLDHWLYQTWLMTN